LIIRRRRRLAILLGLAMLGAITVWTAHVPLLAWLGRLIVEDDLPQPVDLGAIVTSAPVPAAEEMARLVRDRYVPRVVVFRAHRRTDDVLDRLGISAPRPSDLAVLVMQKLRVSPQIVSVERVDDAGTNVEIRALAFYMRRRHLTRVAVVADRSHTRRVASLLRAWLGQGGLVVVRAPRSDPYEPDQWWRSRESSRELIMEALRWINSFLLRDWWRAPNSRPLDQLASDLHILSCQIGQIAQSPAGTIGAQAAPPRLAASRFLEINPFVIAR
jgi:hypothetical protein